MSATSSLTIAEAAAQLGLSPRQLKYAISKQGAPVVARGSKGRTHKTLVDPDDIRRWLNDRNRADFAARKKQADDLIHTVAHSHELLFRAQSGPHKPVLLANLLASFYTTAEAIYQQQGLAPFDRAQAPEVIKQMERASVHFRDFVNLPDSPKRKENM